MSDQGLIDALRDRIADLGDPGAVVIGYAAVVEVITPDSDVGGLRLDPVGASGASHRAEAGWQPDEGDDQ